MIYALIASETYCLFFINVLSFFSRCPVGFAMVKAPDLVCKQNIHTFSFAVRKNVCFTDLVRKETVGTH